MLSMIIWSLIIFFLVIGVVALVLAIVIFFMDDRTAASLWFSQICGVCFVIVLIACIAGKGVGL